MQKRASCGRARACRLRWRSSAAATSSRVAEGFAWLGGRYLERGAAREDGKARKKVS